MVFAEVGFYEAWWIQLLKGVLIFAVVFQLVPVVLLAERKLLGRFQHRYGPNRVGPFGIIQPLADIVKLATKEPFRPTTAVGVIYAVLLAFVVIVAWENFDEAEQIVGQEASTLRGIYRDSLALPPEARAEVQDLVVQYATNVTTREWPSMALAEPGDPSTGLIFDDLTRALSTVQVETPAQQEFVGAAADRLSQLVSLRSQRLDFVEIGIPGVLWLALIIGGVVTIGFALLFGLRNAVLQFVMVGSLAALVGVLLFVALSVNYPFTGDVAVQPDAFVRVLDDFGELPSADSD